MAHLGLTRIWAIEVTSSSLLFSLFVYLCTAYCLFFCVLLRTWRINVFIIIIRPIIIIIIIRTVSTHKAWLVTSHLLRSSQLLCDLVCRWISGGDEFASSVTSLVAVDAIRWSHISVRMLKQLKQQQQQRAVARRCWRWEAGADDRTGRRRNWKLLILNYFRHIVCGLGTDVHACVHVAPVHRSACHLGHKTCRYPTPGVAAAVVSKPLFVVSTALLNQDWLCANVTASPSWLQNTVCAS